VLDDSVAVAGIGKAQPERFGVIHRLLQTIIGFLVLGFRLDDGDGVVRLVAEEVIDLFPGLAIVATTKRYDATVGEIPLFIDLVIRPAGVIELGQDVLSTRVRFCSHVSLPSLPRFGRPV
jgi:hypothetical protein